MVPTLSIVFMGVSTIISIGLPIALFFILRKKYGLKAIPMLVGAAAFVVFALVLEQLLHMLILRPDAGGAIALKDTSPALYVLYGIFAAGVFEETARFISFKLLKKKYEGIGTALSYGIGHGGIEAILLIGVSMIGNILFSMAVNAGAAELLSNTPQAAEQVAALIQTSPFLFLVSGLERIMAVAAQIALSIIVWHSVNRKGKVLLYPLAIIMHAVIDIPAVLMQIGVLESIALTEGLTLVVVLFIAAIAVCVCKRSKRNDEISDNIDTHNEE